MEYLNAMASFMDQHTLVCSKDPKVIRNFVASQQLPADPTSFHKIKAKKFVIATGTRPQYLEIEGSQLAITSDDIFSRESPPGKTLVVGGGYVAVEIAGFLRGLGYEVSMMTRGDYLRSFDK
jgi:thioredoxin reductase (NADPH)